MKTFLFRTLPQAAAALALAGCASIAHQETQELRVELPGVPPPGADCTARNDQGEVRWRSGEAARIRRSASDLQIRCVAPGQPPAEGIARSRANVGMVGNFLLAGGLLGAAIDHGRGAGYNYPHWIELRFGQKLVFDQALQEPGKPLAGHPPGVDPPRARGSAWSNDCQLRPGTDGCR